MTGKPILKLTNKDYNENGLSELLVLYGSAYNARYSTTCSIPSPVGLAASPMRMILTVLNVPNRSPSVWSSFLRIPMTM